MNANEKPPLVSPASPAHNILPTFPPDVFNEEEPDFLQDITHAGRGREQSAPPAYSTLPYRDVQFDLAPILNGKVGDIEMETSDGKRLLVHKKVLEAETVFFHIYYGFVPAWRLTPEGQSNPNLPPNPHIPTAPRPQAPSARASLNPLNCIPNILTAIRTHSSPRTRSPAPNLIHSSTGSSFSSNSFLSEEDQRLLQCNGVTPPFNADVQTDLPPPPLPPKDKVSAPTPTTSPYTWSVPESSSTLIAFLSLIYPVGAITVYREQALFSLEMTSKVLRAAMGYQSSKAIQIARDHLISFIDLKDNYTSFKVYALGCFFKFEDTVRFASEGACKVRPEDWSQGDLKLMGRRGAGRLMELQARRLSGIKKILRKELHDDGMGHEEGGCGMISGMKEYWTYKMNEIMADFEETDKVGEGVKMKLIDLLNIHPATSQNDQCSHCLVLFGQSVRRCLIEIENLPRTV